MHGTGAILHSAMAGIGRESQNAAHQRYRAVARKSAQKHDALPRLALREKSRPLPGWLRDDATMNLETACSRDPCRQAQHRQRRSTKSRAWTRAPACALFLPRRAAAGSGVTVDRIEHRWNVRSTRQKLLAPAEQLTAMDPCRPRNLEATAPAPWPAAEQSAPSRPVTNAGRCTDVITSTSALVDRTSPSLLISQYLCIIRMLCGEPVCCSHSARTTLLRQETRELVGVFWAAGGREEVVSVGPGVMPRGLRVAAARVRRARPARWRQRRDAWQRSPRYGLPDTLTPVGEEP